LCSTYDEYKLFFDDNWNFWEIFDRYWSHTLRRILEGQYVGMVQK
jgi:hypothetical protein